MAVINVNGKALNHSADPRTPLLWVLREQLGLTGTKYGCGIAQCGACTVMIDGVALGSTTLVYRKNLGILYARTVSAIVGGTLRAPYCACRKSGRPAAHAPVHAGARL